MSSKSRVNGASKRSVRRRAFNLVMSGAAKKHFHEQIATHHSHVTRAEWSLGVRIGRLPRRRAV